VTAFVALSKKERISGRIASPNAGALSGEVCSGSPQTMRQNQKI
jgi:hypothetical protein